MINAGDFATSIGMLLVLSFLFRSLPLQQGYAIRALAAAIILITAFSLSHTSRPEKISPPETA